MKREMRFSKICMALLLCLLFIGSASAVYYSDMNLVINLASPVFYSDKNLVITHYLVDEGIDLNNNIDIGTKEVYWNQRMVGEAIVEGATTVVQFDPAASEYVEVLSLRNDVIDSAILQPVLLKAEVESLVLSTCGSCTIGESQLFILMPDSAIFPVTSEPTHPSWVVYAKAGQNPDGTTRQVISIFDSVTGDFLGYGVSPPVYSALSINGPDWGATYPNCNPIWHSHMMSAKNAFDGMGYSTEGIDNPTDAQVQSHIQSGDTALFYELDHGGSYSFHNDCPDSVSITSTEVATWIASYTKMPFTFVGSCEGLCNTGAGTFSHAFRKGSTTGTSAVGYCHMEYDSTDPWSCTQCWGNSINWQNDLFNRLKNGETVKNAFDNALADYPMCGSGSTCMRFDGDPNLKLSPVVIRGSLPIADAGPDQTVEQTSLAGASVTLDGSGSVEPNGATLTYEWTWSGGSATGMNPVIILPLGTTVVTLTVDDGFGSPLDAALRSDTVSITVSDTTPPVLTVPADVTVEQATTAGTVVPLTATATDICDTAVAITSDAPAIYPLGDTTVTFTATDDSGNSASGTMTVHVVDSTPPALTVPADVTVEQATTAGTVVPLTATATDICDTEVDITSDAPLIFPLGDTPVAFTATDDSGNSASGTMTVHVVDTTPPDISVTVTPDNLWPPNHQMVDIKVMVSVTDVCDASPTINLISITSNEPDDAKGNGDGNTVNDIQEAVSGSPDYVFKLRAERAGEGNGRVYTITYTATDASGNSASTKAIVVVSHERSWWWW